MNKPSEILKHEIKRYFEQNKYPFKKNLGHDVHNDLEYLLKSCDFVYVSEFGSVIHADRFCGNGFLDLVPIHEAIAHGYTCICARCAYGTYVESLVREKGIL